MQKINEDLYIERKGSNYLYAKQVNLLGEFYRYEALALYQSIAIRAMTIEVQCLELMHLHNIKVEKVELDKKEKNSPLMAAKLAILQARADNLGKIKQ